MREGLMISSFSDGLIPNDAARACLQRGLVRALLSELQQAAETALESSVMASPCNGPNTEALRNLESVDEAMEQLLKEPSSSSNNNNNNPLELLQSCTTGQDLELRFVYIPTAMYALRPESNNTPGKQRQRARADGKKRRNEIVQLLQQELSGAVNVAAVTLDLDDGSIKQPESTIKHNGVSLFPKTGEQALTDWNPHFVYVQGGNTFWLYHCLHKGNWKDSLVTLLQRDDTYTIGVSAGAILAGASMETACWKGWDDPRVVPGMETYQDWKDVPGLRLSGDRNAYFPHYVESQWSEVVKSKGSELKERTGIDAISLRDDQVCHVDGSKRKMGIPI